MTCRECELLVADDGATPEMEEHLRDCVACGSLQQELRENALVLSRIRDEVVPAARRGRRAALPWMSMAAAAAVLVLATLQMWEWRPVPQRPVLVRAEPETVTVAAEVSPPAPVRRVRPPKPEPLKIKMLTSDPNVVIYWLIDPKEGE